MGCPDEGILRVFAIEGFLIGIVGLALGIDMGLVITWNLDVIQSGVERTFGFRRAPRQRVPAAAAAARGRARAARAHLADRDGALDRRDAPALVEGLAPRSRRGAPL